MLSVALQGKDHDTYVTDKEVEGENFKVIFLRLQILLVVSLFAYIS